MMRILRRSVITGNTITNADSSRGIELGSERLLPPLLFRLRAWVILKLIGRSSVAVNLVVDGSIEASGIAVIAVNNAYKSAAPLEATDP